MCWIDTDLETQQKHSDKILLVIYFTYVHLQFSVVSATIVMLFYQNIDKM